jgi:hypothetical protein
VDATVIKPTSTTGPLLQPQGHLPGLYTTQFLEDETAKGCSFAQ